MENDFGQILMQERMAMFDAFSQIAQVAFTLEVIALLALLLIALFLSATEDKPADSRPILQTRRRKLTLARVALVIVAALIIIPFFTQ